MNRKLVLLVVVSLFASLPLSAATFTSVATGNWNVDSTWDQGAGLTPGAGDQVVIAAGTSVSVTDARSAGSVSFPTGAAGNAILNVTSAGALTVGAGGLLINGDAFNYGELFITGVVTTTGDISFTGTAANARLHFDLSGTPLLITSANIGSGGTILTGANGTIRLNGTSPQTIAPTDGTNVLTYGGLEVLNSAGVSVTGDIAFDGPLSVAAACALNVTGAIAVDSSADIDGGLSSGTGVTFAPTSTLDGTGDIGGSGLVTFASGGQRTIVPGADINIVPTATVDGGIQNDGLVKFNDDVNGSGTWTQGVNSKLSVVGSFSVPSFSANAAPNTVVFDGAGPQVVPAPSGGLAYHHLDIIGSGPKNASGSFTVNGNFTLSPGVTFTIPSTGLTFLGGIDVDGTIDGVPGTLNINGSTGSLTGDGTGRIDVGINVNANKVFATAFGFNASNAPAINIGPGLTVTNTGSIAVSGVSGADATSQWVNDTGSDLAVWGSLLPTGTLNASAAGNRVSYISTASQTVYPTTYANLQLGNGSAKTISTAFTISENFTIDTGASTSFPGAMTIGGGVSILSSASLTLGAFTHQVGGSWNQELGTTVDTTRSTVVLNGSGTQVVGGSATTFDALTINKSAGTVVLSSNTLINGVFTILAGAFDTTASFDASFKSNVSTDGLFTGRAVMAAPAPAIQIWSGSVAPAFSHLVLSGGEAQFDTSPTVSVYFALTGGNLTMQAGRRLTVGAGASITRTSGFVLGQLELGFNAGQVRTFDVGTGGASPAYAPVEVFSVGGPGNLTVEGMLGVHRSAVNSNALGRWWNLTNSTLSNPTVTFFYNDPADIGGGNEAAYVGAKYTGTSWVRYGTVDSTNNKFVISGLAIVNGQWTAGEAIALGEPHWAGAVSGNWSTGANWTSGAPPLPTDIAYIDAAGTYTVTLDTNAQVAGLRIGEATGSQTLSISTFTLQLDGASTIGANGVVTLNSGAITGAGAVTNSGVMSLLGGTLSGTGAITNSGTVDFSGSSTVIVDRKAIANNATMNWSGSGAIDLRNSGRLHNAATGVFLITNNAGIVTGSAPGDVVNFGILRKDATGATTLGGGVSLSSSGTIDVLNGSLRLEGPGNISGNVMLGAGTAALVATGGYLTLATGATFGGAGTMQVNGGTLDIGAALVIPQVTLDSGTITGSGNLTVDNGFNWNGGVVRGTGGVPTITLNAPSTINSSNVYLDSRLLQIAGATTWIGSHINLQNGAGISVLGTGTLTIGTDAEVASLSGIFAINNAGAIVKSTTSGVTLLRATTLTNSGSLDIQSGTIRVEAGGSNSGPMSIASGATFLVSAGTYSMNAGSSVTGAGKVAVNGGTIAIAAPLTVPNLELGSGSVTGPSDLTVSGTFVWNGGTVAGTGLPALNLPGTTQIASGNVRVDGRVVANSGTFQWGASQQIDLLNGARIDNASTGVLIALGDRQLTHMGGVATAFNNAGTFRKDGGTGETFLLGVPFTNSGTVDLPAGALRVDGAQFTQTSTGALTMKLAGTTPGTGHSQIRLTSAPSLAGNFNVVLDPSFVPNTGDQFRLFAFTGAPAGDFNTPYNLPAPGAGQVWSSSFDGSGLLLALNAVTSNLSITKTASATNVPTNTNVSFTIQVANAGPDPATNVSVTDVIPAGMTVVSAGGTGWSCTVTTSVVCTLASLPVGPASPLVIDMTTPPTDGAITNVANVSATETDPDSSDNSGSAVVNVGPTTSFYVVTTLADSGPGSLRQALADAEAGICVPCNITFNVPAPGVIDVLTQLPSPNTTYSIDGASQPGYAGTPLIGINGLPCGAGCHGFSLQVASSIRGLAVFNFFDGGAVWLEGSGSNSLTDSWIGIDLAGTAAPNLVGVVFDGGSSNTVASNRIANNTYGIYAMGTSTGNLITSNVIEMNSTGGIGVLDGTGNNIVNNTMRGNGIGIDLGDDGVTANDAGDSDAGGNNLQNSPVIGSATINAGTLTTLVSVDSSTTAARSILVQLFKADASGTQGETLIVEQCFAGNAFSSQTMSAPSGTVTGGASVVATATSWAGTGCTGTRGDGTSEFSAAAVVVCSPTAVTITAPPTVCAGGSATASVPAIAGAMYAWTVSNGTLTSAANGSAITFVAGATGSVSLSVSVTNSCGAVSNAGTSIAISAPPAAVTASGPTNFCAGGSVTLTANAGATGFTYLWSNGATGQSIVATTTGNYSVTVTDGSGCSTTSAPVAVTVDPAPSVVIDGPTFVCDRGTQVTLTASGAGFTSVRWSNGATTSSITVSPTSTTTYSVQVSNAGGCIATDSHTVSVGSGGGALTVTAPPTVAASSAGNTASVVAGGSGVYTWVVLNGTLTSGQGTPSITFDAGTSGSVTIHVTLNDNGCAFNGTVMIPIAGCASAPPSLLSPAAGETVLSPVTFSWTAVPGATDYEVWLVDSTSAPSFVGLAPANATSLSARVESGSFSWYVVARLARTCSPSQLTSERRPFTVTPATNCPSAAPQLVRPINDAATFSPITLQWTAVSDASLIGYRVMASLGGLPAVEIDTVSSDTTQLIADLPIGAVRWWVEALYEGCPPVRSGDGTFAVVPEECSRHGNANLIRPADGSVSPTSSVEFEWSAVDGADGYAVWIVIDDEPFVLGSTVGELRLTAVVPPGLREWWVEAKFEGCPSTESAHRFVRVTESANCPSERPSLSSPSNGSTFSAPRVTLSWTSVPNTLVYEVWLSVNGGSDALVATSPTNDVTINVPTGEISWFVRARVNGCSDRDSDRRLLRYAPPAACSTATPILLLPLDDGRPITSPATFRWTSVPGATEYKIYLVRANGVRELLATTRDAGAGNITVPNGESRWMVEAVFASCPSTQSSVSKFVAVASPSSCTDVVAPVISVPGQVSAGTSFTVQWTAVPGADSYLLAEFAGATSRVIPVNGQFHTFSYPNTTNSAQTYVYQVRGVDADCNPAREGTLSAALGVTVLPARSAEGSTVVGSHTTIDQVIPIGAQFAGQSFAATPLQPWVTVQPSSGVVPENGIDLLARADVTALPLGTSVAGVQIAFAAPQSGRIAANGSGSVNTSISINLVTPVTPTPKSAPGPDALIIPAVAHAQGVNAQFQSDVRVSNTSAQVMKYQLTFVPSGEAGMTQGRQTSIDIEPGRTIALDDILRTWFGTGGASVLGTLEIRPLTQAGSSTSSAATRGVPNFVTFASSRTFNSTLNGTFGTYIPAIPFANFVGRATGTASPQVLSLQQIAQSDAYRSNLGLLEGSGNPAEVLVSVFNSSGGRITQFPVQLTGGQHLQIGSFLSARGITLDDGRVEAQVIGGSGRVMAYAAVVNNATGDSMVVTPVSVTQSGSTKYVLPGVAELSSGTPWQTDMRLLNAGEQPVTATLSLHSLNGAAPEARTVEIAPGETKLLDRVLATMFGVADDGGALHITTSSASKLIATARTYRPSGDGGNFGQFIQAVTPNEAIAVGSRPLQILQVEESQRFRSNIGLAEVSGLPAKVEVTVIPPDAKVSAKLEVDLAANQFRQLNSVLSSLGFSATHNARVTVRVISGQGRVTAYAATIDQITQDPTFVPAQ